MKGSLVQHCRSFNCRSGGLKCRLEKLPCNVLSYLSGCDRKDKFNSSKSYILDCELLVNITLRLPRVRLAAVAGDILNCLSHLVSYVCYKIKMFS